MYPIDFKQKSIALTNYPTLSAIKKAPEKVLFFILRRYALKRRCKQNRPMRNQRTFCTEERPSIPFGRLLM